MKYEITLPAEDDLIEIFGYTAEKWGEKQAKQYINEIAICFEEIADRKLIYRQELLENNGIKFVRCEHHYVFFLLDKKPIIIAVLHEKMDFIAAFKKRLSV